MIFRFLDVFCPKNAKKRENVWKFGKYVVTLHPLFVAPVPEGICLI